MKQFFKSYILHFLFILMILWSGGCYAQATISYISLGTSSGNFTFTAPSCGGISFTAQCWAGGGGGGGSGTGGFAGVTPGAGGGGSGGGFAQGSVTLSSSGTYYYSVGAGGSVGSNAAGGAGGATWFNGTAGTNNNTSGSYINATGGSGGPRGSGGSGGGQSTVGGATYGSGVTGTVTYIGGTGASGNNNDASGDGGGGGGGAGSGQNGSNGSANGTTGGGGGNGGNNSSGSGHGSCTGTCLGDYTGGAGSSGGGGAGGGGSIPAPSSYSGGGGGFPGGAGGGSHSFSFGSSQPGGTGGGGQISISYVMPVPVISSFTPTSYCGTPGSTLTITGCGFMTPIGSTNLVTAITINGTSISGYTVVSASSITVPASSLTGLSTGVIAVTTKTSGTLIGTATTNGTAGSVNQTLSFFANPTVNAGSAQSVCAGATTAGLGGSFGGGATAAVWTDGLSGGSAGTFSNNGGSTPGTATYTASLTAPSSITLTLTTSGGSCGTTAATKTLTVNPNPTVNAGSALSAMCQGATTVALGGSYGGGATSAVWSDGLSGGSAGSFSNNSGSTPGTASYTASSSAPPSITLTLTTSGGSCGSVSASKTVSINPNPTVTIHTPAAVCSPSTVDLTASAVTAGSTTGLTYTYWNDAGATSSYATPSAATGGTYYIKGSTAAGCYEVQPVTVTIKTSPVATASNTGPYLTAQTISLSSGPSGQTSYAWSGPSGYTASGQNQTRSIATLSMAGYYTVTVTASNGCTDTAMTYVVVNIPGGYTWTGATSTDWTVLSNWSPTPLAGGPSGCTESVIIPVVSHYPILTSAVTIGNVTINDNAQLTLNASLSVCGDVTGGTTASGNILGTGSLIMTGNVHNVNMSGILTLNTLVVNEYPGVNKTGGALTINKVLTLTNGNFDNYSGSVTLASNASGDAYLDNFSSPTAGYYVGNMTVQRYISNTADGYRDISSPVATTVADLNAAYAVSGQNAVDCYYSYSPYPNLQFYDEPLHLVNGSYDEHWVSWTNLTGDLGATRGFAFRTYVGAPYTINFNGPPYNGTQTTNITHTSTATPSNDGFNLIGNPYPSPVRWSLIKGMNGGGLGGTYYVNHTTGAYTGTWGSYNGVTGVNGAGDVIAIGQGFFVQTSTSGSLTMNNSVRTGTSTLYYRPLSAQDNEVRLSLSNGVISDEIVAYTDPQGTSGFDPQLDAVKMPAAASVYISYHMPGYYYAINVIDAINDQTELPLALYARDTGTYTLTASTLNVQGMTTFLKNGQTNVLTDLSAGPIPIRLNGGQTDNDYSVIFKPQANPSGIINTTESSTRVYSSGDKIYVARQSAAPASISVINMIGQSIKEQNTGTEMTVLELPAAEPWYAIVKVTEGEHVTVAKVLISGN